MPDSSIAPPGARTLLYRGDIQACDPWFKTSVEITAAERYFFRASGSWTDWTQVHDPNGSPMANLRLFERFIRCKEADATWFTLVGTIDKDPASFFAIGDGRRWPTGWIAPASGRLFCFANDARLMYFNNRGAITLEVWTT
ncbi:hypothetical protein [Pseudomonas izuensis]|uniref:hypothetical protein n=1 Tax=Pseudomonas izuensis TaxID=2684212 RepID=UPI00135C67E1|nr:hypothetical protein [Pseudomonas izuensis]